MTITTAKTPQRPATAARLPAMLALTPLALAAMLLSAEARADWKVTPRLDLRETYSDNVGLQDEANAHGSFVSEVSPSVRISTNGPRLKLNAEAGWREYAYSDRDAPNLQNSERRYNGTAQAMLVDQLLYVNAGASSARRAISAFGPVSGNTFSAANRTDIRSWNISPYLRHRFGSSADMTVRYARDAVDGGLAGFGNSMATTRSADIASGTAFTTVGWNLSYYHQDLSERLAGESSSEFSNAGLRWNLIRRFSLTANVGYDKYEYPVMGEGTSGRSWSTGFIWTPSTRTSVQASFGHRYFGKTGLLRSSYRTQRSVWNLDYNDQITTTRSQFTLPAAIDTAAMLDGLFAASFPDPVQRQEAVQAYIAATGLPPALADSINYLSNRYIRIKRLQGAAIFRGTRGNLTFTLYDEERNAMSTQQSDSTLLLGQLATLNDNTRQYGASAHLDYRLSPRSGAYANLSSSRVRSLSADITSDNSELRLGMNHRFASRTQGSLELRHTNGRQGLVFNSGSFHENALVATLSVQY